MQTEIWFKYNLHFIFVFFVYFPPRSSCLKDQFTVLNLKCGIPSDMCFKARGTHITSDMGFQVRGTHITSDIGFSGRGTGITSDMC